MEQKFYNFDEAIKKLGISAEKLNELRESGMLRAYRDGSSWKFRGDEIEGMAQKGVPDVPPPSDIGLIDPDELVDAEPLADLDEIDDLELGLADEDEEPDSKPEPDESAVELPLADTDALSASSELELVDPDDTVTAETSDVDLEAPDRSSDASDSILLSEEELGESVTGSLSTIIGRKELESEDADLELELADDVTDEEDTKLSASSGASDIHSTKVAGSGVLDDDDDEDLSSAKRKFEDLEELEIDLAAESSLALDASDLSESREKAKKSLVAEEAQSDLKLDDEEAEDDANMGSTDVPLEELSGVAIQSDEGSGSELDLAGDDDLILADSGGSDLTLDSGDSGINLLPSDSGLALDDMPLDVGGSAILSSLSLEGSDPEISLLGGDSNLASLTGSSSAELQTDDDFQLTPLSEGGLDDGDSSSQVIALDADLGGFEDEGNAVGVLEADAFSANADEGVVLSEEFGSAVGGVGMESYAGAAVMPATESQYTLGNILLLMAPTILLILAGIMMLDMVRNIWSWDETYSLNSSMLEALLGMFGLN